MKLIAAMAVAVVCLGAPGFLAAQQNPGGQNAAVKYLRADFRCDKNMRWAPMRRCN